MAQQKVEEQKQLESTSMKISFPADLVKAYKQKKIKREKGLVLVSILSMSLVVILGIGANVFVPPIPPTKIVKGTAIKQEQIVVGQPVTWTMLVERNQIENGKYLAKLPRGASGIKIVPVSTSEAKGILSAKPKQQLSLYQRQQSATIAAKKESDLAKISSFSFADITYAFKYLFADVGDAVDNVVQTIVGSPADQSVTSTPVGTYVDLSNQSPAAEANLQVAPTPEVTPAPETTPEATPTPETTAAPVTAPSSENNSAVTTTPVLTTITIVPLTASLTLGVSVQQLMATTLDQNGNPIDATVVWSSDNTAVATVDNTGIVTPQAVGTANITASSGSVISSAPAVVTVVAAAPAPAASEYVAVQYTTPAPEAVTIPTDTGEQVTVSAVGEDPAAPLTDIIASTKIPEIFKVGEESKIHIKWKNNNNQNVTFHAYDTDGNGYLDYVEWTVPHLSEQIFEIIFTSKAFRLDASQNILEDIYPQTQIKDGNYASLTDGQYVRVTFIKPLTSQNDNTIYAKPTNSAQPGTIQVYPAYTDQDGNITDGPMITTFPSIDHDGKYRVLLTGLQTPTDVFDLKIVGNIDIDFIVDPGGASCCSDSECGGGTCNGADCDNSTYGSCSCSDGYAGSNCQYSNSSNCSGNGTVDDDGNCSCSGNWSVASNCSSCVGNWSVTSGCTTCLGNWDSSNSCNSCISGYEGDSCQYVSNGYYCGSNGACASGYCDMESPGWSCTDGSLGKGCVDSSSCASPLVCINYQCGTPAPDCSGLSNGCQNGGTCNGQNTCDCSGTGYVGTDCSTPDCSGLSSGGCQNGGTCSSPNICDCSYTGGYTGADCSTPDCSGLSSGGCQNGGTCSSPNNCDCSNTGGYTGTDCSTPPAPVIDCSGLSSGGCQNGGTCDGVNHCSCLSGYNGGASDCSETSCDTVDCGVNGTCMGANACYCYNGYSGEDCSIPPPPVIDCSGLSSGCQNGGTCDGVDHCSCPSGYTSMPDCSVASCDSISCQNGGTCNGANSCTCPSGWNGSADCSVFSCDGVSGGCGSNGYCSNANTCTCTNGYSGSNCTTAPGPDCSGIGDCQNGGSCVDSDMCSCPTNWNGNDNCTECSSGYYGSNCDVTCGDCTNGYCNDTTYGACVCDSGWLGSTCATPDCTDSGTISSCNSHGTCTAPGTCNCSTGWTGTYCDSCASGWSGSNCEIPDCTESGTISSCNGHGTCTAPDVCNCTSEWTGTYCQTPPPAITDGLVAYYPLDGNAFDYSGGGHNGTWAGTAPNSYLAGNNGQQVASFNGGSYISTSLYQNNTPTTFSAWININSLSSAGQIVGNDVGGYDYSMYVDTDGSLKIGEGGSVENTGITISLATWYHLVAVISNSSTKVYVNGSLAWTGAAGVACANNGPITIGAVNNSGIYNTFNGKIQQVAIWNRALSADDVSALYTTYNGAPYTPLTDCGAISGPGVYVLQNDVTDANTNGTCFTITADNVVLDGNVHSITTGTDCGVPSSDIGINIPNSQSGITIKNFSSINDSSCTMLPGSGVAAGGDLSDSIIENNTMTMDGTDGGGYGIGVSGASSNNTISDNYITSPATKGIYFASGSTSDVISGNDISSGQVGIYFNSSSGSDEISGNTITVVPYGINSDPGIYFSAMFTGTPFSGTANTITPSVGQSAIYVAGIGDYPFGNGLICYGNGDCSSTHCDTYSTNECSDGSVGAYCANDSECATGNNCDTVNTHMCKLGVNLSACITISSPGTYVLNQSITHSGTCLTIASDNVEIDCGSNTITGDIDASTSVTAANAYNGLILHGCHVNGNVISRGGDDYTGVSNGGSGGSITVEDGSSIGTISSNGGDSQNTGGPGGTINITDSTVTAVSSNGGSGEGGGSGGTINITNSSVAGSISATTGSDYGGAGGTVNITSSNVGDVSVENGSFNSGNGGVINIFNPSTWGALSVASANGAIGQIYVDWNLELSNGQTCAIDGDCLSEYCNNLVCDTAPITYGLVALYPLNGNANDYSGNGNNGTWVGTESYDAGHVLSKSASISSGNYIQGTINNFPTTQITLSGWFYLTAAQNQWFFETGSTSAGQFGFWYDAGQMHVDLAGDLGSGWADQLSFNYPLSQNTWYYATISWNGSMATLYINGSAIASYPLSGTISNTSSNFFIGDEGAWNSVNYTGDIEQLAIWNRSLSAADVSTLWNNNAGTDLSAHPLSGCGTISVPGTYTLTQSISPSSSGTCLTITSDNVEIDCGGTTGPSITGDIDASGGFAHNGYTAIINGCSIAGNIIDNGADANAPDSQGNYHAGSGGSVTIINSSLGSGTGSVSSNGGASGDSPSGTGGTVVVTNSTLGDIAANGGSSVNYHANAGGTINITDASSSYGALSVAGGTNADTGIPSSRGHIYVNGTEQFSGLGEFCTQSSDCVSTYCDTYSGGLTPFTCTLGAVSDECGADSDCASPSTCVNNSCYTLVIDCSGLSSGCQNGGTCNGLNTCDCSNTGGYSGADCSIPYCVGLSNPAGCCDSQSDCSSNNMCVNHGCTGDCSSVADCLQIDALAKACISTNCYDGNSGNLCSGDGDCNSSAPYCISGACSSSCSTSADCLSAGSLACVGGACYSGQQDDYCNSAADCIDSNYPFCTDHGNQYNQCEASCNSNSDCTEVQPSTPYCNTHAPVNYCTNGGVGAVCYDSSQCSPSNTCIGNVCAVTTIIDCSGLSNGCQNGGTCDGLDTCDCSGTGYTGNDCSLPDCSGLSSGGCQNGGTCSEPNSCSCIGGYTGLDCSIPPPPDCSGVGGCSNGGTCISTNTCSCVGNWDPATYCGSCVAGYEGSSCQYISNGGYCTSNGACASGHCDTYSPSWSCTDGSLGKACDNPGACASPLVCNNRQCSNPPPDCSGLPSGCQNGGTCNGLDTCDCSTASGYTGVDCSTPLGVSCGSTYCSGTDVCDTYDNSCKAPNCGNGTLYCDANSLTPICSSSSNTCVAPNCGSLYCEPTGSASACDTTDSSCQIPDCGASYCDAPTGACDFYTDTCVAPNCGYNYCDAASTTPICSSTNTCVAPDCGTNYCDGLTPACDSSTHTCVATANCGSSNYCSGMDVCDTYDNSCKTPNCGNGTLYCDAASTTPICSSSNTCVAPNCGTNYCDPAGSTTYCDTYAPGTCTAGGLGDGCGSGLDCAGYTCDTFVTHTCAVPTITTVPAILDTSFAQTKTISATSDFGTVEMTNTTGTTCDGSLTNFVSNAPQTFTSESDNGTQVCYKATDSFGHIVYSLSPAVAGIDTTAPTGLSLSLTPDSSTQITATASGAVDSFSGLDPAPYQFRNITFNAVSAWQSAANFVDVSLTPNTQYSYQARARDVAGNTSGYSSAASVYTLANIPLSPAANADSDTQITASWQANFNPSGTEYYVENITDSTNSGWITSTNWSSSSLTCGTSYSFRVKARNGDLVETSFAPTVSATTNACNIVTPPVTGGGGGGGGGGGSTYIAPVTPVTPVTKPVAFCHNFVNYLAAGSTDATTDGEVSYLQTALTKEGFDVSNDDKGVFGNATVSAVEAFQLKYQISQTGTVGPVTRFKLSSIYGCPATTTTTTTTTNQQAPQSVIDYLTKIINQLKEQIRQLLSRNPFVIQPKTTPPTNLKPSSPPPTIAPAAPQNSVSAPTTSTTGQAATYQKVVNSVVNLFNFFVK